MFYCAPKQFVGFKRGARTYRKRKEYMTSEETDRLCLKKVIFKMSEVHVRVIKLVELCVSIDQSA